MSGYWNNVLIDVLVSIPAVLLCLSVHEAAHGWTALLLGDPTAKNAGRLTLDPLRHLDPIGTLCMLLFHVGWAKPVPVNVRNFRHPRRDIALTSLAGPLSNFVLALLALFAHALLRRSAVTAVVVLDLIASSTAVMSIGLGVFNLIPVPPLDGSKILFSFLPYRTEMKFARYEQYIQFALLALLFVGVLDVPLHAAISAIYAALQALVGLVV